MRLYIAGMYTNGTADRQGRLFTELMNDDERRIVEACRYQLESYHYIKNPDRAAIIRRDGARVFLDSGAFSAHTLGKVIDLNAYCKFIREYADIVDCASVLDGIGDPLLTYQNQCLMEQQGVQALPCFHWGEDERYLEYYIDRYEYITLGGMVQHSTQENRQWLDHIFGKYICDDEGRAKIKIHGFGLNNYSLMSRYPWYSVDASSWVAQGANGNVVVPKPGGGIYYFPLSSSSSFRHKSGQHLDTLTPLQYEGMREMIEARGVSIERLQKVYISRWVFNLESFLIINADLNRKDLRFKSEQISIF